MPLPIRVKNQSTLAHSLYGLVALVWFINGLFCKALNLVPRHQQIVGRILGNEHAELLTRTIGCLEVGMAVWILSGYRARLSFFLQVILVATMNIIEFIFAPDLLLFGRFNIIIATCFIAFLFLVDEFFPRRESATIFSDTN